MRRSCEREGKDRVRFAVLRDADGVTRGIGCDLFVLSVGLSPRDDLVRMSAAGEVETVGDAAAEASPTATMHAAGYRVPVRGRVRGGPGARVGGGLPLVGAPEALHDRDDGTLPGSDVRAAPGGVRGGPGHREGAAANAADHRPARTTARPPARPVPLDALAAAVHRGDREAHVPARRARGRRRPDRMVRLLASPLALRGRRGGVPRRPRARVA